jgi:hypothetical protein
VNTAGQLAAALHRQADGICSMQAAASLLTAQAWLHRTDLPGAPLTAAIDRPAAIAALDAGQLPAPEANGGCSASPPASPAESPVDLREALNGLDQRNLDLLVTAIRHACGQPPGTGAP